MSSKEKHFQQYFFEYVGKGCPTGAENCQNGASAITVRALNWREQYCSKDPTHTVCLDGLDPEVRAKTRGLPE